MDLTKHVGVINRNENLLEKLKERVFLKTQLDVVYADFTNWERGNLISIGGDLEKGKWKHLNYTEYVWVKIVEELRAYGFSYDEIYDLKLKILEYIPAEDVIQSILDSKDGLDIIDHKIYPTIIANKNNIDFLEGFRNKYTRLDTFLANAIIHDEQCSVLFFKHEIGEFSFLSKKMIEIYEKKDALEYLSLQLSKTHLSVSLNKIISKFINTNETGFLLDKSTLLSGDEYALLKIIRNKPQNLKQITIKYVNDEIDLIEIETIKKKVEVESRLMDHIKKGEYSTIQVTCQDGRISSFTKKEKIKL